MLYNIIGLALNQGNPHISLEAISSLKQQSYVTVRNIKVHMSTIVYNIINSYSISIE